LTASPKQFLDLVATYRNAVVRTPSGKYVMSSRLAPGDGDRQELQRRHLAIQAGLRPAPIDAVERRMAKIFVMFPVAGVSAEMMRATVEAYAGVLSAFPLWALDRACQKIIASGATFRPSAPEIRKLVVAECDFAYNEADDIQKVLSAEPYNEHPQGYRDRVKAGFHELIAGLTSTNSAGRVQTPEQAKREVDAGFPDLQGPLTPSAAIKASCDARGQSCAMAHEFAA
jgi:hypothetical protein